MAGAFDEPELPSDDGLFAGPDLDAEVRFGALCNAYLSGEPYKKVTAHMRETIHLVFEQTPLRDRDAQLHCRLMLKILEDMHELLTDAVDTGRMSAEQLEAKNSTFKATGE